VRLRVGKVIFEDDTMWYAGSYFRRDVNAPATWINVEVIGATKRNTPPSIPSDILASSRGVEFSKDSKLDREYSLIQKRELESIQQLFMKASFNPSVQSGCKTLLANSVHECAIPYNNCNYPYDLLGSGAGNYYLAAASARCMNGNQECAHWQSTNIANSCSSGGGGGGNENPPCQSDWDCDFGYSCNQWGDCEDDYLLYQ